MKTYSVLFSFALLVAACGSADHGGDDGSGAIEASKDGEMHALRDNDPQGPKGVSCLERCLLEPESQHCKDVRRDHGNHRGDDCNDQELKACAAGCPGGSSGGSIGGIP